MNKDLHKYSDAELLSFYRRTRKPDYLIGLYERYMPLVYGVALKYLKNVPDAQDAVMQIWEELFEKVLHHDIQVFKAWLYSCVRNYCLMELRRRSGNNFVGLDEKFMEFCDDFNLEYSRETDRQEKALQECMEALPTMTGIKYRTRAMMGGCQGGFCQMKIEHFIEQELGTEPENVRYSRQGSWVLTGNMRKEEN